MTLKIHKVSQNSLKYSVTPSKAIMRYIDKFQAIHQQKIDVFEYIFITHYILWFNLFQVYIFKKTWPCTSLVTLTRPIRIVQKVKKYKKRLQNN